MNQAKGFKNAEFKRNTFHVHFNLKFWMLINKMDTLCINYTLKMQSFLNLVSVLFLSIHKGTICPNKAILSSFTLACVIRS